MQDENFAQEHGSVYRVTPKTYKTSRSDPMAVFEDMHQAASNAIDRLKGSIQNERTLQKLRATAEQKVANAKAVLQRQKDRIQSELQHYYQKRPFVDWKVQIPEFDTKKLENVFGQMNDFVNRVFQPDSEIESAAKPSNVRTTDELETETITEIEAAVNQRAPAPIARVKGKIQHLLLIAIPMIVFTLGECDKVFLQPFQVMYTDLAARGQSLLRTRTFVTVLIFSLLVVLLVQLRYKKIDRAIWICGHVMGLFLLSDLLSEGSVNWRAPRFRQWAYYQFVVLILPAVFSIKTAAWVLFLTLQFFALPVLNRNIARGPIALLHGATDAAIESTVVVALELAPIVALNVFIYRLVQGSFKFCKKTLAIEVILALLALAFLQPRYPFVAKTKIDQNISTNVEFLASIFKLEFASLGPNTIQRIQDLSFSYTPEL